MARGGTPGAGSTRWLWLSAFLPLFGLYLLTLCPTVPFEDGGEMISPAFTLGVHHPPGYPVYALLGRLSAQLPLGSIAFRFNLLSAACGAAACGLAACVAWRVLCGVPGIPLAAAWLSSLTGGLLLGTAPQVWWQSVIAEKYAMNLAFNGLLALVMAIGLAALRGPGRIRFRWLFALALGWGISASHHGQTVYFAPAAALLGWWAFGRLAPDKRARAAAFLALLAVFGMSVKFLYPPIRSATTPLFNWNEPSVFPTWADYMAGGPYQYRILYWTPAQVVQRLGRHLRDYPFQQFGWPGVALALLGLGWLTLRRGRESLILVLVWATGVAYCVNFSLEGIAVQTYYMPTFMLISIWIACGIAAIAAWAGKRSRAAPFVLAAAIVVWGSWQGAVHGRQARRDRHYFAYDFSNALLRSCAPGSLLVAYTDYDLFPLWYTHYVLGVRPDVILVNSNFVARKDTTETSEGGKEVFLIFPRGHEALGKRFVKLGDLVAHDPGRPVFSSVVYEAVEGFPLLPDGAAYRLCRDPGEIRRADVMAERRRFVRWRTVRGVFDDHLVKDSNTRSTLSYYPYEDYRRGFVLEQQGREEEAVAMYRTALRWPDFYGEGRAAAHASIGRYLYRRRHDVEGAIKEYREAVRVLPDWLFARRALGAILTAEGRWAEALDEFSKVLELAPRDAMAVADVRRARAFAPARAGKGAPVKAP